MLTLRNKSMGSGPMPTRKRTTEDDGGCMFSLEILPVNSSREVHRRALSDSLAMHCRLATVYGLVIILIIITSTLGFLLLALILFACINWKKIGRLLLARTSRGVRDLELGHLRNQQQSATPRAETVDVNDRRPTIDTRTDEEVDPDVETNAYVETAHIDNHRTVTTGSEGE
ncbi:hypothetical protein F5B22DRAFT_648217 [Xylaria bambusicola]|uniref:uncharacterized protein n=1 Tax=Xylaria bambusicola TaxID=326684 RepID=UPI0020082664|nr:uncharacterized protein F5B22DRAFT_648217 [Xylaria bambusicola]KAI0512868.1 hypothetical protein F5B22DRAFT_648217 [Xylaria bambusicola]